MNVNELDLGDFKGLANVIRGLSIDAVEAAGHGHPGAAMGMADIATVLYGRHLRFCANDVNWHDRDRVILSNGHASALLYSLLYLTGTTGIGIEDIKDFRKKGSITPGHPEAGLTPGVEVTTGPLGQGFGMAVGMALAELKLREDFGAEICNHRTWVFAGDGCLMEGVGQEAASLAGHLKLGQLNLLYDMNNITIDGPTALTFTEDTASKFKALGWHVTKADGHEHRDIDLAIKAAKETTDKPSIILFNTVIGHGAPTLAGTSKVHGAKLGTSEAANAKKNLGLPEKPFEIRQRDLENWRRIGQIGQEELTAWNERMMHLSQPVRREYERRANCLIPDEIQNMIIEAKREWSSETQRIATRKASQACLEMITELLPEMIGGSADLTGSNLTKTGATQEAFKPGSSGRYINYGVREFLMGTAMNGMAMHGGVFPFGGTFLVFSDYMRNAIRLSALMNTKVIYIMTHDSIGLGEDGPTHQPVEHLASLRAIPGLNVFRPADIIETLEAYEVAVQSDGPSLLALSRQVINQVRINSVEENLVQKGGYLLTDGNLHRDITLIATGSEVGLAIEASKRLGTLGVSVAVVSLPCWSIFDAQPLEYRKSVLGNAPRLAIEAASPFGWTRYVKNEDHVIGVDSFGASASSDELYSQFGLTVENICAQSLSILANKKVANY